jgi:hypothetical protein
MCRDKCLCFRGEIRTEDLPERERALLPAKNMMNLSETKIKDDFQFFFSSFSLFSVVPGLEQGEPGRVISPPLSPDYRQREED